MGRSVSIISRFADFYKSRDVENVFYRFVDVFGQTLDQIETDLLTVMRAHWVDSANNEGSQGFNTTQKGDLDKIFSLYLENLGGTSQLKQANRRSGPDGLVDDALYRERITGLIEVLKRGASTKEGIITLVAANLGIVGTDPKAVEARGKIRIVEFLPEPFKTELGTLALFEKFGIENPNLINTTPEIRLRIRPDWPTPLVRPRLINLATNQFVQYNGTVKNGDALSFFPDSTAFLNGIVVPIEGETPFLPPGLSEWRFEALLGLAEGRFEQSLFDFATFEEEQLKQSGVFDLPGSRFDEAVFAADTPAIELSLTLFKLTPASFMVRIPWDIPGFTEKFGESGDHPRNQIQYIVNKIKAAGVLAVIAYEKQFTETHELAAFLTLLRPFTEEQQLEEANFDIGSVQTPYPAGLEHEMSDSLVISGVFDYTRFDSLNTFA